MKSILRIAVMTSGFLLGCVLALGQTPIAPQPIQNIYAIGVSGAPGASPAVAGNGIYAHLLNDSGTYAFSDVDFLPSSTNPFTVTTNVGVGVAQKVTTIGKVPIFMPTAAGISFTGSNTGWQWGGGVLAAIHLKGNYYLMPNVRFIRSNVSTDGAYQPIIGIDFAWGQ